ncbi:MAG: hypothetical protein Q9164_005790 [Protoblastenia rupestris]
MSSTRREQHFREGTDGKKEPNLRAAEKTLQEDDDFRSKALKDLRKKPSEVRTSLKQLDTQIQQELESLGSDDSDRRQASLFLEAGEDAHGQWGEKGRSGSHRAGRAIQRFATTFAGFVREYAGLVDILRQSNGAFSEVAYGTLSLFFMAAVRKSENDTKYADTLQELRNSFPRMKTVEDTYLVVSVKERVHKVYREVVIFARASFKYFLDKSWRKSVNGYRTPVADAALDRVIKVFVSPASIGLDQAIERVHSCLAEVNAEINIQLHQRVQDIWNKNKHISDQNRELITKVDDLKSQNNNLSQQMRNMEEGAARETSAKDQEYLEDFCRSLGVPPRFADRQLCRENLAKVFPGAFGEFEDSQNWCGRFVQMSPDVLESSTEFQSWKACSDPSLLVLAGVTAPEGRAYESTWSWLSPAALHIAQTQSTKTRKIAFFSCHPNVNPEKVSVGLVLSSLLYQVIAWKPEILRHRIGEFDSVVRSDRWNAKDARERSDYQIGILKKLISELLIDEEIVFVLDRIDLYQDHPKSRFLQSIQNLVGSSSSRLKVLIIMEKLWDDIDRGVCRDLVSSGGKCRTFSRLNWDQGRK